MGHSPVYSKMPSQSIVVIPKDFLENAHQLESPEPIEPLYDLPKLPDPSEGWPFLGRTQKDVYWGLKVPIVQALMSHHLWGFKCYQYAGKPTKKEKISVLFKYFYYMQEEHLPRSWDEVLVLTRDAGPRLLKWSLDPTPAPVSKFYPELPPKSSRALAGSETWDQPPDAPADMPRTYIAQFQFSANERMDLPGNPIAQTSSIDQDDGERPTTSSNHPPRSKKRKTGRPQASSPLSGGSTSSNPPGCRSGQLLPFQGLSSGDSPSQAGISGPGGSLSYVLPAAFDQRPIREEIERVIMKYTYRDLERHPSAPYKGPIPHRLAERLDDLAIVQSGAFPSIDRVKLNLNLDFDESGYAFPYRGRGPVCTGRSCVIDCTIVLGTLLDAGCTVADRSRTDGEHFTDLEKAFVEATNMNWDALSEETSKELRDSFFRVLCTHVPSIKMGKSCPVWTPWSECTKNFAQFQFHFTTTIHECHCQNSRVEEYSLTGRVLNPFQLPGDRDGVTLDQLWQRCFPLHSPYYCAHCGSGPENDGPSLSKRIDQLPLRLVVQPEQGSKVFQHTRDQIFDYVDSQGNLQQVVYRWLGGIYHREEHTRVYWGESKRFETPTKRFTMYDSSLASGTIISLPTPADEDEIVSIEWVHDPDNTPIWVYERVLDPEISTLVTAVSTANQMGQMVEQNIWFKYAHTPWNPLPGPPPFNEGERLLPSFGDHFLDSKRPDPFDTLPDHLYDVKIPDWMSLVNIDPSRDLMAKYGPTEVQSTSRIPDDVLNPDPPSEPEDGFEFNTVRGGPQSFAGRTELWPGTRDVTGALDFPDLSSRLNSTSGWERTRSGSGSGSSRPSSGGSFGSNRPFTIGEYLFRSKRGRGKSRSRSKGKESTQEEDVTMGEAPPLTQEEEDIFTTFTTLNSSHRASSTIQPVTISQKKRKRLMREQVLAENAKKTTKKMTKGGEEIGKDARNKKNRAKTDKRGTSKPKEVRFEE